MMSAWWLCLIVPVSFFFGFGLCALLVAAKEADRQMELRKQMEMRNRAERRHKRWT